MSIVKMKKARMFVLEKQKMNFLEELNKLGLVHLSLSTEKNSSQKTEKLENELKEEESSFLKLKSYAKKNKVHSQEEIKNDEILSLSLKIKDINKELEDLENRKSSLELEIARISPFGDFSISDLFQVIDSGLELNFYSLSKNEFKDFDKSIRHLICTKTKEDVFLICINDKIEGKELFKLPEVSLASLKDELKKVSERISILEKELISYLKYMNSLKKRALQIQDELNFSKAFDNLVEQEEAKVSLVNGFIPQDKENELKELCSKNGFGLLLEEVEGEEEAPTLLKNNMVANLIKPVLDFIDITPGYKELDISIWFLAFFTMFTGILIGDAGYGAVFFLASLGIMIRFKPNIMSVLFILLSLSTIIWGSITGTWFGMSSETVKTIPIIGSFVIESIANSNPASMKMVQTICFFIAVVHLSLAHILAFFKKIVQKPHIHAFMDLGKLLIILGIFNLVLNLVIGPKFVIYPVALWAILVGFILNFLFSSQTADKSFIKGVLDSIANVIGLLLDLIASFSDVVSYIRLYAVGAAGYAMAHSFNAMILGPGTNPVIGYPLIAVAHALVMLLAILSVMVHGIRLNTLEFSLHLGNEWSGFKYDPFKRKLT